MGVRSCFEFDDFGIFCVDVGLFPIFLQKVNGLKLMFQLSDVYSGEMLFLLNPLAVLVEEFFVIAALFDSELESFLFLFPASLFLFLFGLLLLLGLFFAFEFSTNSLVVDEFADEFFLLML